MFQGCQFCIHFQRNLTCAAFPNGIPMAIVSGQMAHDRPLEGQQNQTVFEPKP